jgi:flavin reductase (DIM6/NTAB) family NADH-FMN oxidoreductase RutF
VTKVLKQLKQDLESEGYKIGSAKFEKAFRARKVGLCKSLQGVRVCSECRAYLDCELIKQHLADSHT